MAKKWDREAYRKEIREKLEGLSREQQVAFALRCALRSLPMLVVEDREEPFGYWKEEKRLEHLKALEKALDGALGYLSGLDIKLKEISSRIPNQNSKSNPKK